MFFVRTTDSVATTPTFSTPPVLPGDTLATSIHVVTDMVSTGTAHVQIEVGTFHDPNTRYVLDFIATTDPSVGVNDEIILKLLIIFPRTIQIHLTHQRELVIMLANPDLFN